MPLYDYECKHCKKTIEIFCKFKDNITRCPECNKKGIKRVLSRPSVIKGPGSEKLIIYRDRE